MKRIALFVIAILGFVLATTSHAQTVGFLVGNVPQVDVKIINNTDSRIGPVMNGTIDRRLTEPGGIFERKYIDSSFGLNGQSEVDYNVRVCTSPVVNVLPNLAQGLPDWAMNKALLGDLAITPEFLGKNPGVTEIKQRVENIKRWLDQHDATGRNGRLGSKHQLDDWFKAVKNINPLQSEQLCNDLPIFFGKIDTTQYQGRRVVLITISGTKATGYRRTVVAQ
jgi:hypothetical protein